MPSYTRLFFPSTKNGQLFLLLINLIKVSKLKIVDRLMSIFFYCKVIKKYSSKFDLNLIIFMNTGE